MLTKKYVHVNLYEVEVKYTRNKVDAVLGVNLHNREDYQDRRCQIIVKPLPCSRASNCQLKGVALEVNILDHTWLQESAYREEIQSCLTLVQTKGHLQNNLNPQNL